MEEMLIDDIKETEKRVIKYLENVKIDIETNKLKPTIIHLQGIYSIRGHIKNRVESGSFEADTLNLVDNVIDTILKI